jgi:energy-coupling factor transporter ATP-binding protein EcfA2
VNARRGPLAPIELATAAVMAALTVVLELAGAFVPHASAVSALGVVPAAVVAHRHRPRAVVASTVAACSVGFLVAGTAPLAPILLCALVGGLAGHGRRHGWGPGRVAVAALAAGPLLAGAYDALLALFSSLRRLILANLRNSAQGVTRIVGRVPGLHPLAARVDRLVAHALVDWWQVIAVSVVVFVLVATLVTHRLVGGLLTALSAMTSTDRLEPAAAALPAAVDGAAPAPVPVTLDGVGVRYPGAVRDALEGVSVHVEAASHTALIGANGSGKSTLARILAGCPPDRGGLVRAGPVGLGLPGGVAVVSQRPESQVLGVRAADDVLWGLPPGHPVDVEALLAAVGLGGMASRETSTLSGGELQRLAVAAAMARRPGLLVADEVTAMVDQPGRAELLALVAGLPAAGVAVVQVTHRPLEAAAADQVVRLDRGHRMIDRAQPWAGPTAWPATPGPTAWPATPGPTAWPATPGPTALPATPGPTAWPATPGPTARPATPGGAGPSVAAGLVGPPLAAGPSVAAGPTGDGGAAGPLELRRVGHVYAAGTPWAHRALEAVDLTVETGGGVIVVGDNGSGKSTLVGVASGLLQPSEGEALLGGRPVAEQLGVVAVAFQHARLQIRKPTVGADVCAAAGVGRDAAEAALAWAGLDGPGWWDRPVDRLSGGELRRVALAGLLAARPAVLLADEPLAGLDDAGRRDVLGALAQLRFVAGSTVVVVSHDLEDLEQLCDRVVRLERGRVVADEPYGGMLPALLPEVAR